MNLQEPVPQYLEEPAVSAPPDTSNEFNKLHVLVVDDNPLVRKGTQGIVESWGCRVSMASSLKEVQDGHIGDDYDLVVCDYRLPDGDGIELADWIKANFTKRPLFILISGDASPEVLQMVNERGIQFLHKPVRPAKLRSLIQYLLNQKKQTEF
jgi:CheY-like chemotaxis protein